MADAPITDPPQLPKQAVVLIHGIGEQRPMTTLWQMVELVWMRLPRPPGAPPRRVYSEPDDLSGVFELRRLSTNPNAQGKRTDFFEYYWAHLMHGNELADVLTWLGGLALRRQSEVPPQLHKAWRWLRIGALAAPFVIFLWSGGAFFTGAAGEPFTFSLLALLLVWAMVAIWALDRLFFSPVLGDAARYLRPSPKNVSCRQEIRARGLKLLEALHASGKYDRIVLVGHSLGGIIAYELVCHLWGRRHRDMAQPGPIQDALAAAEAAALELEQEPSPANRARFQDAQSQFFAALQEARGPDGKPLWLISDIVTLGSPIAHADVLMANGRADFDLLRDRREILTSPPWFESFPDGARRFSYSRVRNLSDDSHASPRAPHNSAAFAAVRWTNIYFPQQGIIRGDMIGGPCAHLFGQGVADIAARAPRVGGLFPHLDYFKIEDEGPWGDPAWADHREALRAALRLEGVQASAPSETPPPPPAVREPASLENVFATANLREGDDGIA